MQTSQTDEFGVPLAGGTQGSRAQPFGYTGEQTDPTGLLYLRARSYEPVAGRFLSRDPFTGLAASPQSLNRYAYVGNNPVNLVDPSGMVWERMGHGWQAAKDWEEAHRVRPPSSCGADLMQPCPFSLAQLVGGLGSWLLSPEDILGAGAANHATGGSNGGGRGTPKPRNHSYADRTYHFQDPELAAKNPGGVKFDSLGYDHHAVSADGPA